MSADEKKAKSKSKKPKKWIKLRHSVVRNILYFTLGTYSRIKYRTKVEKFKEQEKRPYLVLLNHQTPFDQFFVGMSFRGPLYYLATEDIFSNGFVSSLIRYLAAPIPIKKQTMDVRAVINCMKVSKEGGTIVIAPEGNRTYSGKTEYMSPSITALARKLGNPIVLYRLEGGYGVQPRWSDVVRKGKMRAYVYRVIKPEEYATMTDDELFAAIKDGLDVNEAVADATFYHKKSAEYLERALYTCPFCGLSELESHNDTVKCLKCGREVRYLPTKELEGVGFEFPHRFVNDWYEAQKTFMNSLDVREYNEKRMYLDHAEIREVIPYKNKNIVFENAALSLYGDRIEVESGDEKLVWDFENVRSAACLGRNKLNVYYGDKIYQIKGGKRFNSLKYVHVYHRCKNIMQGEMDCEFLGL